jgi:hypothetical protein
MAIWIEYRCENRVKASPGCWSHENDGPMGLAGDNRADVLDTLKTLDTQARALGWRRTRAGWCCPVCARNAGQLARKED